MLFYRIVIGVMGFILLALIIALIIIIVHYKKIIFQIQPQVSIAHQLKFYQNSKVIKLHNITEDESIDTQNQKKRLQVNNFITNTDEQIEEKAMINNYVNFNDQKQLKHILDTLNAILKDKIINPRGYTNQGNNTQDSPMISNWQRSFEELDLQYSLQSFLSKAKGLQFYKHPNGKLIQKIADVVETFNNEMFAANNVNKEFSHPDIQQDVIIEDEIISKMDLKISDKLKNVFTKNLLTQALTTPKDPLNQTNNDFLASNKDIGITQRSLNIVVESNFQKKLIGQMAKSQEIKEIPVKDEEKMESYSHAMIEQLRHDHIKDSSRLNNEQINKDIRRDSRASINFLNESRLSSPTKVGFKISPTKRQLESPLRGSKISSRNLIQERRASQSYKSKQQEPELFSKMALYNNVGNLKYLNN